MFGIVFPYTGMRGKAYNAEQPAMGFTPKIMVYEDVPLEPARWEYKVLTIDTHERSLPDEAYLNELGHAGWLLVGILNQGTSGNKALVHYHFVRQIVAITKK